MKDTDKELDEEVHGLRPGMVPSATVSVCVELGNPPFQHMDVFTNLEVLYTVLLWRFHNVNSDA